MSISDEIKEHLRSGKLVPVIPETGYGHRSPKRYILLAKSLNEEIEQEINTGNLRFAELKADLVTFQCMSDVDKDLIKQLKPPAEGVWEIRSQRLDPTIRVFGQFAEKNLLIATSYRYRGELGNIADSEWEYEKKKAKHTFNQLFPCYSPKTMKNARKLFDGALCEKYYDD